MHLLGIGMDSGAAEGAHLGGLGGALRYRPVRHFGFDLGLDFIGGTDYKGDDRWELPISASALMYVNPHSASQLYFLAGLDWSSAGVRTPGVRNTDDEVKHYVYFGGHIGIGMEFRVTRLVSINADLLGFMRNRVDSNASRDPEFIDAETGAVTNTSGGAMLRAGATLYF